MTAKQAMVEYLTNHRSATVAVGADGEVRAFTVGFAFDETYLYLFILEETGPFQLLVRNSRVALTVDEGFRQPMKGVEIVGAGRLLRGTEERAGQIVLERRFPLLSRLWGNPNIRVVRVEPERAWLIDWDAGLGHSEEVTLGWGDLAATRGESSS